MAFNAPRDDDEMMATINTTPLVDVMLVLLIIFLITIPVVTHTVPIDLPRETNQPTQTEPRNVTVAIDRQGEVYWNQERVRDGHDLLERARAAAALTPQPEIHVRGDQEARYEPVGRVVAALQRAGIVKLGFITQPPDRGG
ncbi:biopolymer transporter ExbD [Paramagnetospirillum kuznetsovii]|uniref:Biopolymer transporter ExbD n=1 Tax=Paramagnetospirillum kuznetsovii TaxID=2053833 RepID=A0A364NZ97_9PROT|nr:biopolymer transporter ExbD [Paramagnetospirillum kuznetsovii]RAU22401.1 biopolymer transporter ExbD [Paramagnetospirillum kuznetsovii]